MLDARPILGLQKSYAQQTLGMRLPYASVTGRSLGEVREVMTSEEFRIADLGTDAFGEILALWQRAGLSTRPDGRDAPDAFARQMASPIQRVLGLRAAEGRLVAVVVLTHDGRKGWINRLAVDPAYRRQGLARTLVAAAERWFTEDLRLEVWAALIERDNGVSQAMFRELGYEQHDIVYVSKRTRADA